jgi:hypothetical protein
VRFERCLVRSFPPQKRPVDERQLSIEVVATSVRKKDTKVSQFGRLSRGFDVKKSKQNQCVSALRNDVIGDGIWRNVQQEK